jgi:hypothetical protein
LKQVLTAYCRYRGWESVAPKTAEDVRLLIQRAGSVEDALEGLRWFFSSKWCDDWVCETRPDLGLPFLIENFERFEIYKAELPKRSFFSGFSQNEYALMRGVGI